MNLPLSEQSLLAYLDEHAIAYTRFEHPPVFTCAEADRFRSPATGLETKNLFLRGQAGPDGQRSFYLVMTACEKRLDMKGLGQALGEQKLHFASKDQLFDILRLTPGSVTMLALLNDAAHRVHLLVDAEYWPSLTYLCHPLVNTATLVLTHEALLRFFKLTGHVPQVIDIPPLV